MDMGFSLDFADMVRFRVGCVWRYLEVYAGPGASFDDTETGMDIFVAIDTN